MRFDSKKNENSAVDSRGSLCTIFYKCSLWNLMFSSLKGVSLAAAKERGQLVFLEGLKSCLDLLFGEEEQPGQPSPLQFLR